MRNQLLTAALLILAWPAFSQEKIIYLDLAAGLTTHTIKDDAMSPVRYKGLLPTVSFGILKEKTGKKFVELYFPIQYGNIHAKQHREYPSMKGPLFRLDINYVHLRQTNFIRDTTRGTLFLGGCFHTLVSFRFMTQLDNSAIIYDYANSLGVSLGYRRSFEFSEKKLTHYHRISIPIVSLATRPDYMNVYDVIQPGGNDILSEAFGHAKIRSFGTFQRVMIRNSLFYPIRGTNRIGLTYEWLYYGASYVVPIHSGSHSIIFSLLVNI